MSQSIAQTAVGSAPVVSVIVPAYRAAADIQVALDSIFAQTFSSFEVIVINDGSPDGDELEAALAPYVDRIRYIVQPNAGAGAARNTGIRAARGKYVAFLDADDVWLHDFLRRQVWFLDANAGVAMVYSDAWLSGDSPLAGQRFMHKAPSSGAVTLESLIAQRCNVILSTVVVRRDVLDAIGLFDETLRRGQDFDLWLRMASQGARIAYQRLALAERRVRSDGLSGDSIAELERALNVLERFSRVQSLDAVTRTMLRVRMMTLVDRLEIEQGKRRFLEGHFAAARYHLSAARERPLKIRLALLGLQIAPRLLRAAYVRLRAATWTPRLAGVR